ncbi:MAG: hypothetical protein HZB92_03340 [Euryarchaeota archaeon]|nr:hypothetical protein [Euryarchaeota archaeon]
MTRNRLRTTCTLLLFGFVFIFQVIASSYIDFYPRELLVGLGFSIGIAMVVGSVYALAWPEGQFWNTPDTTAADTRTRATFGARAVPG